MRSALALAAAIALGLTVAACKPRPAQAAGGPSASAAGQKLAQGACADSDAACLEAQARQHEQAAERLLNQQGEGQGATPQGGDQPVAGPAAGGGLVDGEYDCGVMGHAMGKVDIQGGQFRYRPMGEAHGGFAPFSTDGGLIHWGGPFPGIDDTPPARITESTVEAWGFNVKFQVSPDGYVETMSCHAPGR